MTSPRKVAANQTNGRKSGGPNTRAGKARASRNARRHGLSSFITTDPKMSPKIKEVVDLICDGDDDPLLRQQAIAIAQSEHWLSRIRAEKVTAVERLRDATVFPLIPDTSIARGRFRLRLFDIACAQEDVIDRLIDKAVAAGLDPELEPLSPKLKKAWPPRWVDFVPEDAERDEHEALREGIRDIERLDRYERRAWSALKKALRAFLAIKVSNRYQDA
jgi:hypothetical protein